MNSLLTKEQRCSILSDMLDQKLLLDEHYEEANYTSNGLVKLSDEMVAAKKLLMDINSKFPSYSKDSTSVVSL